MRNQPRVAPLDTDLKAETMYVGVMLHALGGRLISGVAVEHINHARKALEHAQVALGRIVTAHDDRHNNAAQLVAEVEAWLGGAR